MNPTIKKISKWFWITYVLFLIYNYFIVEWLYERSGFCLGREGCGYEAIFISPILGLAVIASLICVTVVYINKKYRTPQLVGHKDFFTMNIIWIITLFTI